MECNYVQSTSLKLGCWPLMDLSFLQTGLAGFYDVSYGEDKQLAVKYRFRNVMHEVMIADGEPLKIPRQCEYIQT